MNDESGIERLETHGVEVVPDRRTIVTALPLKKHARERLSQLLGARVLDVREPCEAPDMVLTPACSPQLIGGLKRKYGAGARIVIVELDDDDLDIELGGPVKRLLRSGADAYLLADSLEELAAKIGREQPGREPDAEAEAETIGELTSGSTIDELIAAFLRESIEYSTRDHPEQMTPRDGRA